MTIDAQPIEARTSYDTHIVEKDGQFTWYDETGDIGGTCATRSQCYDEMDEYARVHLG